MRISLIQVPYHYGLVEARVGTGLGPVRYLEAGADRKLRGRGFEVDIQTVLRRGETQETLAAVAEANTFLAEQIAGAVASGAFPLVLSGGCSACLGVLAGLGPKVGIIWFDAHGDFNTPDTTPSGFFEGMPLAIATGLGHQELWSRISKAAPVPPTQTLLVGVRDLDPGERDNLEQSRVQVVTAADVKAEGTATTLKPKLAQLRAQVEEIYLHFDIDVLDPQIAPAWITGRPAGFLWKRLKKQSV